MTLEEVNARLKAAKIGISIECRGDRLSLRGTLPPKIKLGETKTKQRTIPLKIYANPAGLKRAEKEARKLGGQLGCKEFNWDDWEDEPEPDQETVSSWVERFETDYFNRRSRTPKSETTWRTDYRQPFSQLPSDALLTAETLRQSILETEPDTRNRQRRCMALGLLAKFAGLELNATALRGDYSPKRVSPRDLPTDAEISQWRDRIPNLRWQYAFGLMACYGLRNHELFHIDLEKLKTNPVLSLIDDKDGGGKTGARRVWACYPEWWDKWQLWNVDLLPQVTGKTNSDLGSRVTIALKRYGFYKPYNLRHAWAVRTLEFDIPVELAAQQMGHSLKVHDESYHAWISDDVHQRAFDRAMQRPDRPLAP
ncbi:MAG: site-specific integrase [Timaviella obliquedivisa GSE-PSE-MK23-08B]|jgi:integrase|nr:site-specific integrase [Timaviella obliquedivisa GSE-PSE-MK23-08B]